MIDLLVDVMEAIFRWTISVIASAFQFLAGVVFSSMNDFMGSDQNIIINILSPVYNFSIHYLKPISLALLGLLLVWSFLSTMFGKYSTSKDEPLTLFARAVIFSVLIALSSDFIGIIGGTANLSNGNTTPGIVLQMTQAMSDLGTKKDNNKSVLNVYTKDAHENLQAIFDNAEKSIDEFTGYNSLEVNGTEQPSGDESEISDATYQKKKKDTYGYVLSNKGNESNFAVYLISLLLYLLVYGFLFLWIAWRCLKVCSRYVYRFVIFLVLLYMAPLAFACGPSKSTQKIFGEWLKMIVSYGLLLVLTAAFMRISTFVIGAGFYYAAIELSLVNVVVSFITVLMFLKMIFELERYIEKLGLSAIGLPDSVSGITGFAKEAAQNLLRDGMRRTTNNAFDKLENPKPSLTPKEPSRIKETKSQEAFSLGQPQYNNPNNDNEVSNKLDLDMQKVGENDNAFVESPTGNYQLGTDGLMHEVNNEGKAIDDPNTEFDSNTRYEMKDTDANTYTSNAEGMDDCSTYTPITENPTDNGYVEDANGNFLMAEDSDINGGVAIPKSNLELNDDGSIMKFSSDTDSEGHNTYSQSDVGNFVKLKNGGLVNVGNATSYSEADFGKKYALNHLTGRVDDVTGLYGKDGSLIITGDKAAEAQKKYGVSPEFREVRNAKYKTGGDGSTNLDSRNGRVAQSSDYNTHLPKGSRIADITRLEYCDEMERKADGTIVGLALQHLDNGESRYVKYSISDVSELTKDRIGYRTRYNKHNPSEGYLPGNHNKFIQIDEFDNKVKHGDRKIKTIRKTQ